MHWGVTIESFKTGRDGGVDLRYAAGPSKTVVQIKHYLKTGLAGLLRDLKKEAAKVRRLQPSRYVLVTSIPLSAVNKDEIVKLIGAKFLKPTDVLGQEDLNNLLSQHSKVEGHHYKLWLASRAVLDRVIHNAALTRSEFKAREVHEEARRYVPSDAYPQALKMLNDQRVVIIAGPPGVGKSTLANLLLFEYLEKGYQAVLMQRDIVEGEGVFQRGVAQVFYFDDFVGATFLGDRSAAETGTNDRALLNFIALVRATPTARLILTTREHIYSQAMERSERLRNSDVDDLRVVLHMPSYSFAQKARILYNHIYFSDLPPEYQDELLLNKFYFHIIKHAKFNPRLIEWLSSFRRLRAVPFKHYRAFVENLLRDPSEIWRHAYEQEITDAGRSLLLAIFSLGGKSGGAVLKLAFSALHQEASTGCRSEELREVIDVIDTSNASLPIVTAARSGFERYRRSQFAEELRECRSRDEFDRLIGNLEFFRHQLAVDVASLIECVEEAKAEFEEQEDAYSDHMQDEWKERWRDERDSDQSVVDMFESLKGDRD